MDMCEKTFDNIQDAIKQALTKASGCGEDMNVTDIHMQPEQSSGMFRIYDDEDNLLAETCIEEWKDCNSDNFTEIAAEASRKAIDKIKSCGFLDSLKIMKPYYFVLVDENKETLKDIDLIDDDKIMLGEGLLEGLDKELDEFLENLLKD